ncbi:MAG: ArsR/SmtB family transcription factor [Brasilonema sp.]
MALVPEITIPSNATRCPGRIVKSVAQTLPTQKAQQIAEIFGVLADTNRLRLLSALASQELCVCDLAALIKMTESAVCHQLKLLKAMRLVSYRREGRNVYYRLTDSHIVKLYQSVEENLEA